MVGQIAQLINTIASTNEGKDGRKGCPQDKVTYFLDYKMYSVSYINIYEIELLFTTSVEQIEAEA